LNTKHRFNYTLTLGIQFLIKKSNFSFSLLLKYQSDLRLFCLIFVGTLLHVHVCSVLSFKLIHLCIQSPTHVSVKTANTHFWNRWQQPRDSWDCQRWR